MDLEWLNNLSEQDQRVLFAFLLAGTADIHSYQDHLIEEEWTRAENICTTLEDMLNAHL